MKHHLTASLLCLLAACSSVAETGKSNIQTNRKETRTMTDTENAMTPKQLLTRLLKLMETPGSIDDFTPEKLSTTFGVPLENFFFRRTEIIKNKYGFSQKINEKWHQSVKFVQTKNENGHLDFSFDWNSSFGIHPDMTDVCEMKTMDFIRQAKSAGFSAEPRRALGRAPILEGFTLTKGKLTAEIWLAKDCIQRIIIN